MRKSLLAGTVLGMLMVHGVAFAGTGIELGPVLESSDLGMRGGLDSGIFVLSAERFELAAGPRTRLELALRLPLPTIAGLRIEPEAGVVPLDYQSYGSGAHSLALEVTGTVALTIALGGHLWLSLEPVRVEDRFARADWNRTVPSANMDASSSWRMASWAGLRFGW